MHGCVRAAVVVAVLVGWSGFSGLAVPATADAQTRAQPEVLWQAYPLHQRPAEPLDRVYPPEPAGRAPALAAPMQAGDMEPAVPALLAISLMLTAFLLGGLLGLDPPVRLRGGTAPAAARSSAPRSPELEALEAAEARVFVPVRCEIVCRSDSACSRFAVLGYGTDGSCVWLAESPPVAAGDREVGRARAAVAAHQRLTDQLTEQGWEPAGHGEAWYEAKFQPKGQFGD